MGLTITNPPAIPGSGTPAHLAQGTIGANLEAVLSFFDGYIFVVTTIAFALTGGNPATPGNISILGPSGKTLWIYSQPVSINSTTNTWNGYLVIMPGEIITLKNDMDYPCDACVDGMVYPYYPLNLDGETQPYAGYYF